MIFCWLALRLRRPGRLGRSGPSSGSWLRKSSWTPFWRGRGKNKGIQVRPATPPQFLSSCMHCFKHTHSTCQGNCQAICFVTHTQAWSNMCESDFDNLLRISIKKCTFQIEKDERDRWRPHAGGEQRRAA